MSSVVIAGDTSGSVTLQAPAVAGTTVLTLPSTSGTLVTSAGALTLLANITPTAATSVQSLNVFTSTYDSYLLVLNDINTSSTTDDVISMRVAVGGAVDTSSLYTSYANNGNTSGASNKSELLGGTGTMKNASGNLSMMVQITNVNSTTANSLKYYFCTAGYVDGNSLAPLITISGGTYKNTSVLTGFSFFWNSGSNFVAQGSVRVYGYAKA